MTALIISAFPGTGKTHLFTTGEAGRVLDSDSSLFSWSEPGVRNPEFPGNYLAHIKENLERVDLILVSSHQVVRRALKDAGIDYVAVYPHLNLQAEYLERFRRRGSPEAFVTLLQDNWTSWLQDMTFDCHNHVVLQAGEFLSDAVRFLKVGQA